MGTIGELEGARTPINDFADRPVANSGTSSYIFFILRIILLYAIIPYVVW